MALIGQLGEEAVAAAILGQDAKLLTRASGVGAKLAGRIILELKDKVQEETAHRRIMAAIAPQKKLPTITDELVEALIALGCRRGEAETAAQMAREQTDSLPDQIKIALSHLRK
jgi:Holliday junction DNA helicase RuvA